MQAVLRILGPLELQGGEGAVRLGGPKERCLLTVLALHLGEVVAEGRLIGALWADDPPRTAAKTLQNYVLRLRRHLAGCGGAAILTRPPGYLLDGLATDAGAAEALVARARAATVAGDHDTAVGRYEEALALWRGPSIAEFAHRDFARAAAAGLDELRVTAAEERAAALLAAGRHRDAVADGEKLVAEEPLREQRWTHLMLALYRDGRQADALEAYLRLRSVLADALGVEPGPRARELHAAMLHQDPALEPDTRPGAPPAGSSWTPVGAPSTSPTAASGAPAAGPPTALPGRPPTSTSRTGHAPCIGRTREVAALLAHLDDAADGRGRTTFLSGDAGIGKTRLLAEVAVRAAARGARVLSGRCLEGPGALPFHPFVEAIGPGLGHGGAGSPARTLAPDERRARVLDAVARHVVALAADAPVALLLDDLHWADDGTVALLRHVARSSSGRAVLTVGAYRGGDLAPGHPLLDALGALPSETECAVLRLGGLDRDAVAELACRVAGAPLAAELVAAVRAETRGNPFFTREVVRHLQEDGLLAPGPDGLGAQLPLQVVPEGVRQVLARRRRRLGEQANTLLDVAAGIEGPFPLEPVRAVAGLTEADALRALDEALAAGLVVPDTAPDRYDFTHALVRHAVHRELNPSRRLRLHRALGEALADAREQGSRVAAAEIAAQFHRAAALPGAAAGVEPALEAAAGARSAGAHDEEATFLRIASELLPPGDPRGPGLVGRRAVALAWALRFDDAVTLAHDAPHADLAEIATALAAAGSNTHAWKLAAAGLAATGGPGGADPVAWAQLTLLDLDRREAADPAHPGMPLELPGRRDALRILHGAGRLVRRGDLARYAVAAVHGRRDRIPAADAADATVAAFLVGDYASAVPLFAADADEAESHGQLAWAVYCRAGEARCRVALGDLDGARTALGHTRQLVARLPSLALGWQLLHHQGAEDALVMALDEGWEARIAAFAPWVAPGPERHWGNAAIVAIAARAHARTGRADRALPLLGRPVRAMPQAPAWAPNFGRMACEVAEALWLLGRRDHVAVVESALRDKALPADFRFPMTDVRLALARLCALDGRREDARRWFDAARAVLDAQGARPLRAVVDHDEAVMFLRAGDAAAAAPLVAEARAAFTALGMPGWLHRLAAATPA